MRSHQSDPTDKAARENLSIIRVARYLRYLAYPTPLEDFAKRVVPELQPRGLFRVECTGRTLRDHPGLTMPPHRVTSAR